ncbi:MAG: phosphatase [Deltaproteobacteria bacterium]|nr:phosphatase [Deltaproteobacteria bacterium]
MFRRVEMPAQVPGKLLLHSMPGRFEALDRVWHQVREDEVGAIVCLNEHFEIRQKSSAYADAIEAGTVPCSMLGMEIREGGIPVDKDAFWTMVRDVASRLHGGQSVLIHCAGGVGRTAMFAVSVLMALGQPAHHAERTVSRAGSTVETMAQMEMLAWCATRATAR